LQNQNSELVFLTRLTAQEAAYFYSQVVLLPEEERVLEAIRIIEPDIQRIAPKSVEVEVLGSMPKTGFFAKLKDVDEIVPIASMGDGLWNLMGIILILVNAKGKTLLIDEIDVGLHYSVMVDLWKLIWKIAKELDIQVFATTHSQDCWKALGELIYDEGGEQLHDNEIMIHRINPQKNEAISIFTDEIIDAVQSQIEVR
jgi:AAA15 family ATPase/GTPase